MGQYKVPQNVETEDKILGPLSIKQFIYVVIALLWAFLMWRLFTNISILLSIALAFPVTGFFLMLGFGQREGVPFEDFVVAFIRFLIVPRKRMWIKDDSKEVIVKDTPKKDISQQPAKNVTAGQLKQLASIIDTRGNFKDPSISLPDDQNEAEVYAARIIGPAQVGAVTTASQAGVIAPQATTVRDDVLDEHSAHATQVNQMLQSAEQSTKQAAVNQMQQATTQSAQAQKPTSPTQNQAVSQVVRQTEGLTVQRVAAHAQQQLSAGQQVQLRKS